MMYVRRPGLLSTTLAILIDSQFALLKRIGQGCDMASTPRVDEGFPEVLPFAFSDDAVLSLSPLARRHAGARSHAKSIVCEIDARPSRADSLSQVEVAE